MTYLKHALRATNGHMILSYKFALRYIVQGDIDHMFTSGVKFSQL